MALELSRTLSNPSSQKTNLTTLVFVLLDGVHVRIPFFPLYSHACPRTPSMELGSPVVVCLTHLGWFVVLYNYVHLDPPKPGQS